MLAALHRAGVDIRPEAMGVTWDDVAEAVRTLPAYVREAGLWFTVVDAVPVDDSLVDRGTRGVEAAYGPWERRLMQRRADAAAGLRPRVPRARRRDRLAADGRGRPAGRGGRVRLAVGRTTTSRSTRRPRRRSSSIRCASCRRSRWRPRRARLGTLVAAAAYRNAALTAKMISTIDVISGGRVVLGIGAGWKEDEWLAYGYGFPTPSTRLAILRDHLEIITRMLGPGRATYNGEHAHVVDAIHEPKGLQEPRIPVMVGGNGPDVTWRLAARFADKLNLDALPPAAVAEALPVIAVALRRGRPRPGNAAGVGPPVGSGDGDVSPGRTRQRRLREYADLGLERVIVQGFAAVKDPDQLTSLIDDCAAVDLLLA